MIAKDSIEQLKATVDIVDVVSHYLTLKKAGSNYSAVCPFHDEKTPSFTVSPQKQMFYCFGCGAGGDSITFVKDYEHLSYPEAIEKIASLFNFTLRYEKGGGRDYSKVLEHLNAFFRQELFKNQTALDYLKKRGVTDASIEKFQIGYAPPTPKVMEYLRSKAFPPDDAIKSGVLIQNDRGYYFRFEDRITFPIATPFGKIVGFGGRTLGNHKAKYLNSPQSALFNKSKLLYGFNLAKDTIHKQKEVIITEGYMDTLMLAQAGYTNTVATLGTALNTGHIPLLKKDDIRVTLSYDGDSAGANAAFKVANLMLQHSIEGSVVLFGQGNDPADLVSQNRLDELRNLFTNKLPFLEFIVKTICGRYDISNPHQKQKAYNETITTLKHFPVFVAEEGANLLSILLKVNAKTTLGELGRGKKEPSRELQQANIVKKRLNILEAGIIKACYEDTEILDYVIDIIDESFFSTHKEEFRAVLEGDTERSDVRNILLSPLVLTSNHESIKKNVTKLIELRALNDIDTLKKSGLTKEKVEFKIKEIQGILQKLKRGEIVIYESTGAL